VAVSKVVEGECVSNENLWEMSASRLQHMSLSLSGIQMVPRCSLFFVAVEALVVAKKDGLSS